MNGLGKNFTKKNFHLSEMVFWNKLILFSRNQNEESICAVNNWASLGFPRGKYQRVKNSIYT